MIESLKSIILNSRAFLKAAIVDFQVNYVIIAFVFD
jgi:hypothetical protein